ncbi:MAG: HNH endonuclease [Chloroflexi bacterium]|nr:HNH endonuclease [Chloroflexota bacterium]
MLYSEAHQREVIACRMSTPKPHALPRCQSEFPNLLLDTGAFCQGCERNCSRVLEVDHVMPKSDGGTDRYDNLILLLLCSPCKKEKCNRITLTRLQALNRKNGHILSENERNIRRGRVSCLRNRRL